MKQRHRKHRRPVRDLRFWSMVDALLQAISRRVYEPKWVRPLAAELRVTCLDIGGLFLAALRLGLVAGRPSLPHLTDRGLDRLHAR